MIDYVLIVDDEDGVRRTMADWLKQSGMAVEVTAVGDAAAALQHANSHAIDLAILDWNLGTGSDGLQLLEDLIEFHPHLVAILVTGFAARATPLQALRMGVRDYLDKNAEFSRDLFLASVRKLLSQIAPAKKQREIHKQHAAFRSAVEKIIPLVRDSATVNEPVSLPSAVQSLLKFAIAATKASGGVIHSYRKLPEGGDRVIAFRADGSNIDGPFPAFPRTLAAAVHGNGRPAIVSDFSSLGPIDLQSFETNTSSILLIPCSVSPTILVTLELFKTHGQFAEGDLWTAAAIAEIGSSLVQHIVSDRTTSRMLFDAVEAALSHATKSSDIASVVEQAKLEIRKESPADMPELLPLLETIRELSRQYGSSAIEHCTVIVKQLKSLLDQMTGVTS